MQRADILLYKGTSFSDKLITMTGGPFTHAAAVLDAETLIEANTGGIRTVKVNLQDPQMVVVHTTDFAHLEQENIEKALTWALECVNQKYGWLDIANQVIKFSLASVPYVKVPSLVEDNSWDCSNFVTRILDEMGFPLPPSFLNFSDITPNDLGQLFNLISAEERGSKAISLKW